MKTHDRTGRIIVAGSIKMDVTQRLEAIPGGAHLMRSPTTSPGGKALNQAVAASRCGGRVTLVGRIGNDDPGRSILEFLSHEALAARISIDPDLPTGSSSIAVDDEGLNTITGCFGANGALAPGAVTSLPIRPSDTVVAQLGIPFETVESFLTSARRQGALTVLNAASPRSGARDLFALADILIVNERELCFYLECAPLHSTARENVLPLVRTLQAHRDQIVIATLGSAGAIVLDRDAEYAVSGYAVRAVDTTGAGDCFVGTLCAFLGRGMRMTDAVWHANAAATMSVQRQGAAVSMPTGAEVEMAGIRSIRRR